MSTTDGGAGPTGAHRVMLAARRLLDARPATGDTVTVGAGDIEALSGQLRAIVSGSGHGVPMPVGCDGERYDVAATVWRRSPHGGCPDGEWVLELSGSINDTGFTCRHTQPATCAPEDVPGLGTLYDALDAGVPAPDAGWTVRDPAYLAGLAKGLGISSGIVSRHARAAGGPGPGDDAILREIEASVPRPWDATRDDAHPRHPEVDQDDVEVALGVFRAINPGRRMRDETVGRMLVAVFERRAHLLESLRDSRAQAVAALGRVTRAVARDRDGEERRVEAFDAMRHALRRCLHQLTPVADCRVPEGGGLNHATTAVGGHVPPSTVVLDEAPISARWVEAILREADACASAPAPSPTP